MRFRRKHIMDFAKVEINAIIIRLCYVEIVIYKFTISNIIKKPRNQVWNRGNIAFLLFFVEHILVKAAQVFMPAHLSNPLRRLLFVRPKRNGRTAGGVARYD